MGMAEGDWLLVGLVIGVLIGIPLGCVLMHVLRVREYGSVVFERDHEGRIVGIHYVPGGG